MDSFVEATVDKDVDLEAPVEELVELTKARESLIESATEKFEAATVESEAAREAWVE